MRVSQSPAFRSCMAYGIKLLHSLVVLVLRLRYLLPDNKKVKSPYDV